MSALEPADPGDNNHSKQFSEVHVHARIFKAHVNNLNIANFNMIVFPRPKIPRNLSVTS